MSAQRVLDYFNLLPGSIIAADPLYASAILANLGSVGLDSAYHHLFEYGTAPIFVTMGRVKKAVVPGENDTAVVRDVVSLKYTFDERIADGLYCAKSLDLLKGFLEKPESLMESWNRGVRSGRASGALDRARPRLVFHAPPLVSVRHAPRIVPLRRRTLRGHLRSTRARRLPLLAVPESTPGTSSPRPTCPAARSRSRGPTR